MPIRTAPFINLIAVIGVVILTITGASAETGDDYLDGQSKASNAINFCTGPVPGGEASRPLTAVTTDLASDQPVTLAGNGGELKVYLRAGCYVYSKDGRTTDPLRLWVNDGEPLRGATIVRQDQRELVVSNTVGGLEAQIQFRLNANGGIEVQPTLTNKGSETIPLRQLVTARGVYDRLFAPDELAKLRYFREHYFIWGNNHPGHFALKQLTIHSFYLGILFAPEQKKSVTFAYLPNILWSSCVQVEGKAHAMMAYTEFGKNPFAMTPGRSETFDALAISCASGLVEALQQYGSTFKPRQPLAHAPMAANFGWNSWEYFKPSITEKNLTPVLNEMAKLQQASGLYPCFVVDAGYYEFYGRWAAKPEKFPKGMNDFSEQITKSGLRSGIWTSPSWVAPEIAQETGFATFPHPFNKDTTTRIFDPSDPQANDFFMQQLIKLKSGGYSYFKTDFLATAYRIDRDYGHSDYAPERVLRTYYEKIRAAIGEDSYWLACGSAPIPTVGICDASRIGPDVAANWERLADSLKNKLMPRFWMHGNLFWSDNDFLVIAGTGYTKPGQPIHGMSGSTSKKDGFTKAEAQTWANYLIVTGGMLTWSDNPLVLTDEGRALVTKAFTHGGGNPGIPLDYEQNQMPSTWLRREKDRIYVGIFNWGNKPKTVTVTNRDVGELHNGMIGIDVITEQKVPFTDNKMSFALEPHSSLCLEYKVAAP